MTIKRGGVKLSEEQADIVDSVMKPDAVTVVSAGAGSGKTRTMVASVLNLVQVKGVNVDDFALITFTNKATDEMRSRLEEEVQLRAEEAEQIGDWAGRKRWFEQKERIASTFIGTIHRFCAMLLRNFGYTELIPHESEIIMAQYLFRMALKETMDVALEDTTISILFQPDNVHWAPHIMAEYIEKLYDNIRNRGLSIAEVEKETLEQEEENEEQQYRNAVARLLGNLDRKYLELKREKGGVDSNDLLHKAATLVEQYKEQIGPLVASRFSYLFVDEFQDTDELQMSIVQSLSPKLEHVLVVGDRKQAIYEFRGADHTVISRIAENNNTEPLSLSASRRPTASLYKAQSALFDSMGLRYDFLQDKLTPADDAYEPNDSLVPFQYEHLNVYKDRDIPISERIIGKIREFLDQQIDDRKKGMRQVEYSDICVLFRSNYQLKNFRSRMPKEIPIVTDTGGGFFRKPEIIGCYYMLQAILRYPDDVSLDLALMRPFLPFKAPNSIYRSDGTNLVLRDWFEDEEACLPWLEGIRNIRNNMKVDLVPQLLTDMYKFTRVREYYGKQQNLRAIANLEKLVMWSRDLMNAEALTLQQFFDRFQTAFLTGMEMDESPIGDEETKPNAIRFSTVHSAKGLEYPIVILPDIGRRLLSDDQMPDYYVKPGWGLDFVLPGGHGPSSKFAQWETDYRRSFIEEEARIFYVAITRAEHVICMIGHGSNKLNLFGDENWSWKDEVFSGRTDLRALGKGIVKID